MAQPGCAVKYNQQPPATEQTAQGKC